MWYFAWMLGVGLAVAVGIINALWLEARQRFDITESNEDQDY
jgi:cytochrome bd-I ubiquinol oxidase subunit X